VRGRTPSGTSGAQHYRIPPLEKLFGEKSAACWTPTPIPRPSGVARSYLELLTPTAPSENPLLTAPAPWARMAVRCLASPAHAGALSLPEER